MEGEVVIRFEYGGGNGATSNKTAINKDGQTSEKTMTSNQNSEDNKKLFNYAKNQARALATQVLLNEAIYETEKYFTLTDNVQAKRDVGIASNVIKRVSNIGQATYFGATVGGWVGAIIGAVVGVTKEGIDIYQGYDQQTIKLKQMSEQLEYTRQRVGYSLTAGVNGENR